MQTKKINRCLRLDKEDAHVNYVDIYFMLSLVFGLLSSLERIR